MVTKFIILLVLVGLILPAYANVVDPFGVSTCQMIQMKIDEGAKEWYLGSTILENMNNSIDGHIEIIDSDCIYQVDITESFDGIWSLTVQFEGSEKKEFDLKIKNGKAYHDYFNDEFEIRGLAYNDDRLVLEFTKLYDKNCFGYAEFENVSESKYHLTGNIDCFDDAIGVIDGEIIEPVVDTTTFETICSNLTDVKLDYSIDVGKVLEMCNDESFPAVFVTVESNIDGQLTVEIPRTMVYSINQECDSQDLIVLLNGEETDSMTQNTPLSRFLTLDFPAGNNAIEFIGTYTLGLPVDAYCGVIYGHHSVFMSPKFQVEHGFPGDVLCNEGLEVIRKSSDNSQACVKPETTKKLIERGWEPGQCNSIHAAPNVDFRYCSFISADFSGKDLRGADLYNTRFEGANLSGTNLQEAKISRTYFVDANLSGADLRGLDITDAILRNTNITEALVTLENWRTIDIDTVVGLETVIDFSNTLEE